VCDHLLQQRHIEQINRWMKACGMLFHSSTSASRSSCSVFGGFEGGEHVYRVHHINVQLVTNPVIMPAKEEHGSDFGSESLDKHEPRDILHCHVERRNQSFAVAEKQNDRIKNIDSVFYGIQCSLNNFRLSATIMTNSSPDLNTCGSKTVGLIHTLVRKTFPTSAVHTITSIAKTK